MGLAATAVAEWRWLLFAFAILLTAPAALRRKLVLWSYGLAYLVLSKDTRFQLPSDPGKCKAPVAKKKRIIFVRHGESVWNECFNRGFGPSFPVRLLKALLFEASLFFCLDSLFLDSPLSKEGVAQAKELERWSEGAGPELDELRRCLESAVFVTSCLRRATSTVLIAFGQALRGGRPVWVLSCLQEISRNVDTLALAAPKSAPPLPPSELLAEASTSTMNACVPPVSAGTFASLRGPTLPATYHEGNKDLLAHGAQRLDSFCQWVFSDCSPAALQPTVVVGGHSLWFRTFFQAYLPHTAYHECKQNKIVNCGVVMFDLELLRPTDGSGPAEYRVAPGSVVSLRGGFEAKKAKRRPWQRAPSKAAAAAGKQD